VVIRLYNCCDSAVIYMFVSGIGGGSILRLCLLDFITVLTVWLSICLLVVFMSNGGIIESKAKSCCNGV
jgi:hypothetical protein